MSEQTFDAIVLGGGPGGYVCAIRLAQLGLRVACVEAEHLGGVCLNWGCIPSKALISNAHLYTKAKGASDKGLNIDGLSLNVDAMQDWKDGIVNRMVGGIRGLFKGNGVTSISGYGRLVASNQVEVTDSDGRATVYRAERGIVVATGSATIEVPGFEFDGETVIGAKQAVSLRRIPKRLLVVGGGVIGLELGMVYQSFGSELTVVELTDSLLPGIDAEAVRLVKRKITSRGGRVLLGARAEGYTRQSDGALAVRVTQGTDEQVVECDVILVAVGMRPRSSGIGLEQLGVHIDGRGFVPTDEHCRTNVQGVYAIGDVSGMPMLAHKASKEGEVCAEVIAGRTAAKDWVAIAGIVFTDPEIATAGMSETEAKNRGLRLRVGKFPFAALGRAQCLGETEGFVKVLTDESTDRVVGIHVVGPNASDLISEAVLALEMGSSAEDISLTIHPHPTLGEATMEAAAASRGHAIHVMNR